MSNNKLYSEVIDEAEVKRQIDSLKTQLTEVFDMIKSAPSIYSNIKNNDQGFAGLKEQIEQLIGGQKKMLDMQGQLDAANQKRIALESELASKLAQQNVLNQEKNKQLKAEARETLGLNDAYSKLAKQYDTLSRAAKNAAIQFGENSEQAKAAAAAANEVGNKLKSIDASVGQFQRNVGNYTGAISVLEKELANVSAQLEHYNSTGNGASEAAQKLAKQQELLEAVVSRQAKGFATLAMEVRTTQRQLATMAAEGLSGTKGFEELQQKLGHATREMREFNEKQKMMSAEIPAIAALTTVTKGLAGAYAIGAGATALFGDGNEKLEKELQKLMAIMTLIQGLNEAHELIEKKGTVATIIRTTWEKALTVVYGQKVAAIALNREATIADTVATEANIVAQEGQAVAAGEAAVMMETEAAAATGATIATTALQIVLTGGLLLGIGLLIAGFVKLFSIIKDWVEADEKAIEASGKLAEANKKVTESIKAREEIYKMAAEQNRKRLEEELSLAEKSGKNQYEILALKKKLAEEDLINAKEAIQRNNITVGSLTTLKDKWFDAANSAKFYNEQIADLLAKGKKVPEELQRQAEAADKIAEGYKSSFQFQKGIWDDKQKSEEELKSNDAEKNKLAADEQRSYNLKIVQLSVDANKKKNELILGDEKTTLAQKLAAETDNLQQELRLIEAEKKAKLSDPSLTPMKGREAVKEANAAEQLARIEGKERIKKLNEEYAKRELEAYYNTAHDKIEIQRNADQMMLSSELSTYQQKMAAIKDLTAKELEEEKLKYEQKAGLHVNAQGKLVFDEKYTAKEIEAIKQEHQKNMLIIISKGQLEVQKEIQKHLDEIESEKKKQYSNDIAYGERMATVGQTDALKDYNETLEKMLNKLQSGKMSLGLFNEEKEKLDNNFSLKGIDSQFKSIQNLKSRAQKEGDIVAVTNYNKQIADLTKQRVDKEISLETQKLSKKEQLQEKEVELAHKTNEFIFKQLNNRIEKEKNANAKRLEQIDTTKAAEVQAIEQSTRSEQDKAAAIALINENAQIQKEQIAKEQKRLDQEKARNDKLKAIFDIGLNTAVGVSAALAEQNYGMAILIGAMGALELANVIATPIPQYATGRNGGKAEWALTDELGPELYVKPSGEMFMGGNTPSLRYLEAGERVIPHDEVNSFILNDMMKRTVAMMSGSEEKNRTEEKIDKLTNTIVWQTNELKRAYQKGKKSVTVNNKIDLRYNDYIRQQVKN